MNITANKIELVNSQIRRIEQIVNDETQFRLSSSFKVGVDLGTSDVVVVALDEQGKVVAAFLEWANVVKDGVVLDYWNAMKIVSLLVKKAEKKLGIQIKTVNTSYPPGTDPYISINVVKAAGYEVDAVVDEPSSFAKLIDLDKGAVVDIGGGTTGISVVQDNKIIYSGDEPTGGVHLTLTIAGNQKISFDEAEILKRNDFKGELKSIILPVFEKMTDIVKKHLADYDVDNIFLTGGTCCYPGIDKVFNAAFPGKNIFLPHNPLYSTPLAITSYKNN